MAKLTKKYGFSRGELAVVDGKYIITEVGKDDTTDYDLSTVLDSFVGLSGISLSIGVDDEIPTIE